MTTFRGALRATVQAALRAATVVPDPARVYLEYDWPVASGAGEPAISVSAGRWRSEDRTEGVGNPQFWSTVMLGVEYRCAGTDRDSVVAQLDTASDAIETAVAALIVGPPQLGFRRIASIDGDQRLSAEGARHEGAINLVFGFEYPNSAEPVITAKLQELLVVMIREFAAGDSDVDASLREVLAGADIKIPQ